MKGPIFQKGLPLESAAAHFTPQSLKLRRESHFFVTAGLNLNGPIRLHRRWLEIELFD